MRRIVTIEEWAAKRGYDANDPIAQMLHSSGALIEDLRRLELPQPWYVRVWRGLSEWVGGRVGHG
jgi:hypothetical protein